MGDLLQKTMVLGAILGSGAEDTCSRAPTATTDVAPRRTPNHPHKKVDVHKKYLKFFFNGIYFVYQLLCICTRVRDFSLLHRASLRTMAGCGAGGAPRFISDIRDSKEYNEDRSYARKRNLGHCVP